MGCSSGTNSRERFRYKYEAQAGIYEDPDTREITNAPKGNTPEEAFNLFFKHGNANIEFEYDGFICVLGDTAVGEMVAAIVMNNDGTYRVFKVFDRGSDDHTIEKKGTKLDHTSFVQYYTLPGSNNPNEIVHPSQSAEDVKPSDTNNAVYIEIEKSYLDLYDESHPYRHWYAFSDVDQEGYCVFFN
jgi:hypothetical protein